MNRDDIIRMLTEVGLWQILAIKAFLPYLERFAALVAAFVTAEKDKEIERLQDMLYEQLGELTALRADKQMRVHIEQLKEQPR